MNGLSGPRVSLFALALLLAGCCCGAPTRCPCPDDMAGSSPASASSPSVTVAPAAGDVEAATATVQSLLDRDPSAPGAREEALRTLGRLMEAGTLRPALRRVAATVLAGTADAEKRLAHVDEVHDMIAAELCLHGYLPTCAANRYESFESVASRFRHVPRGTRGLDSPAFAG
jgi:hypothetical protein